MSNVAVDLLIDAFIGMKRGALIGINVNMLIDVFSDVMAAFMFAMPGPLEECRC